jgi:hypothetical protein
MIFKCSRDEAQLLARRFKRFDHAPYDYVVDGNEYVTSPDFKNGPVDRHNVYNVIQYLAGRDFTEVTPFIDRVHGNSMTLPCGCRMQRLFDHSETGDKRRVHAHKSHAGHPTKVCKGCAAKGHKADTLADAIRHHDEVLAEHQLQNRLKAATEPKV